LPSDRDLRVIRIGNFYVDYAPDSSKVEAARPSKTVGELVPTEAEVARTEGRKYETAEQLLARITGARGTSGPREARGKAGRRSA